MHLSIILVTNEDYRIGGLCTDFRSLEPVGFALGIVRVQYRSFIGTGAKRSPEKARPLRSMGNARINQFIFFWIRLKNQRSIKITANNKNDVNFNLKTFSALLICFFTVLSDNCKISAISF